MIIIVLVILEQVQTDYFDASVPINKDLQEAVCALISADGSDISLPGKKMFLFWILFHHLTVTKLSMVQNASELT